MTDNIIPREPTEIIIGQSDDLSKVVVKALQQLEHILDMELPEDNKIKHKFLSIKKDAAAAVINAGLKADENRFRRENKDIITRLFDKIQKGGKIEDGHMKK